VITAKDLELRAGARLLLQAASFQVADGDKIGLVGRNGAGKTTLARVLAGESGPAAGEVISSGSVGYLPQDTMVGDLGGLAMDRVLSARGLDELLAALREAELGMADLDPGRRDAAVRRYGQLEERLTVLGGYAAEAEAASLASSLGLPQRVLRQQLRTLSGGQRRRIELARILFGGSQTLLLDEPTNHLDADSVSWLRDHLRAFRGGLVVISHDTALLESVVNKVFYLDADRCLLDVYNLSWAAYLGQRETDARRRRRERVNAQRQASALHSQADKMRAKATKAKAAQNMQRRAERLLAGVSQDRSPERVAKIRFPVPAHCGRTPLTARGLTKTYGSVEVFADAFDNRAWIYMTRGEYDAALQDLNKAINLLPPTAAGVARYYRGFAFLKLNNYPQALADLNEAQKLQPNNADIYLARGDVEQAQENYDAALRDFDEFSKRAPKDVRGPISRGGVLEAMGRSQEALAALETAVALEPGNVFALAERDRLRAQQSEGNPPK